MALKRKDTPVVAKIIAAVTVGYALSPIDLVPDFIPLIGYLDDVILLPGLIWLTIKLIPDEVWQQCKKDAENLWSEGKPKRWYYAIPIFAIYLLIILIIIRALFL